MKKNPIFFKLAPMPGQLRGVEHYLTQQVEDFRPLDHRKYFFSEVWPLQPKHYSFFCFCKLLFFCFFSFFCFLKTYNVRFSSLILFKPFTSTYRDIQRLQRFWQNLCSYSSCVRAGNHINMLYSFNIEPTVYGILFINKSPHTVLSKNRNCGCSACNFIPFLIQKPPPNHKNRLRQRNITS